MHIIAIRYIQKYETTVVGYVGIKVLQSIVAFVLCFYHAYG